MVLRPSRALIYPMALVAVVVAWWAGVERWGNWAELRELWPASVTMVFGSFVAGSTPAGGGAVAFPVFTKVFEIPAADARTFALMIQSVGMTMALLLILSRRIPLSWRIVGASLIGGVPGLVLGSFLPPPPDYLPKLVFSVVIGVFGLAFWLSHFRGRGGEGEGLLPLAYSQARHSSAWTRARATRRCARTCRSWWRCRPSRRARSRGGCSRACG